MKLINKNDIHGEKLFYNKEAGAKIRYVFHRALVILGERRDKSSAMADKHNFTWRWNK